MRAKRLQDDLGMELTAGAKGLDREIENGYCGDLLSDVIANCPVKSVWLTVQTHQNIIAVAVLREIAAIVLVNGKSPDDDARFRADEEKIPLFVTPLDAFRAVGMLYEFGVGRKPE
ncbi:MAG: serine kinase [Deltaproteobacteria bacterium]|nr:serine kinase [Deltaproteobacteria bacterium]